MNGGAWSPNGQTILLPILGKDFRWVTWAINVADGKAQEFNVGDEGLGRPVWLPDGQAVIQPIQTPPLSLGQLFAFSADGKTRRRFTNDLSDYADVLDITADGKMLTAIAQRTESHIFCGARRQSGRSPSKSRRARRRMWTSRPGPHGKYLVQSGRSDISLMNADGSGRSAAIAGVRDYDTPSHCGDRYLLLENYGDGRNRLIRTDVGRLESRHNRRPSTERDLLSGRNMGAVRRGFGPQLMRLPIEGGTPKVLVEGALGITGAISRDGKWVLADYQEQKPGAAPELKISIVPADGGAAAHVLPVPAGVTIVRWAPDGKGVQFVMTRKGASNIWEQPIVGGDIRQVTNFTSGHIFGFNWSEDGKDLLVARGEMRSDVVLISNFR